MHSGKPCLCSRGPGRLADVPSQLCRDGYSSRHCRAKGEGVVAAAFAGRRPDRPCVRKWARLRGSDGRHIALIDGRLFCSRDPQALDRIVDLMNKYPKTSGKIRDVMQVPPDDSVLWAGTTRDVCGLTVGADGLVVCLIKDSASN